MAETFDIRSSEHRKQSIDCLGAYFELIKRKVMPGEDDRPSFDIYSLQREAFSVIIHCDHLKGWIAAWVAKGQGEGADCLTVSSKVCPTPQLAADSLEARMEFIKAFMVDHGV